MKTLKGILCLSGVLFLSPLSSANELQGDTRLACEALLCLTAPTRPGECASSLSRYFSIKHKKPWKQFDLRFDFLSICPTSNSTPQMSSLTRAIASGAGRCDAATLNKYHRSKTSRENRQSYVFDYLPDYCAPFFSHELTRARAPRFINAPRTMWGKWVD